MFCLPNQLEGYRVAIPLQCLLAPAPGAHLANWSTNGRDRKARRGGPLVDSDTDELRKLMTESNSKIKNEIN